MSKKTVCILAVLACVAACGMIRNPAEASERPNVLFIAVDDLRPQLAHRLDNIRTKREVRYEVMIHDIDMDGITAAFDSTGDFIPDTAQVGGEYGWSDFYVHNIWSLRFRDIECDDGIGISQCAGIGMLVDHCFRQQLRRVLVMNFEKVEVKIVCIE